MTRALTPENVVRLLKQVFVDHGVAITHTKVLDLAAEIGGFNAWSHLQATRRKAGTTAKSAKYGLREVLVEHFGSHGNVPKFSRSDWRSTCAAEHTPYWDWVVAKVDSDAELADLGLKFKVVPATVTLPNRSETTWAIEQNLTDRWGELNSYALSSKPGYAVLALDDQFFESLCELMAEELTFIVRKDGKFGVLIEVEFCSKESESDRDDMGPDEFKSHAEMKSLLINGIDKLQHEYPSVEFAYPAEDNIANDRPAVWAFVAMDALPVQEIAQLCSKIYNI